MEHDHGNAIRMYSIWRCLKVAASLRGAASDTAIGKLDFSNTGDLKEFEFAVYEWYRKIVLDPGTEEDFNFQLEKKSLL